MGRENQKNMERARALLIHKVQNIIRKPMKKLSRNYSVFATT